MAEIEVLFLSKPAHTQFRVWYNINKNNLDTGTMKFIAECISRSGNHIYKIAFIALHGFSKWKFNHIFENSIHEKHILYSHYIYAELAKGWLV